MSTTSGKHPKRRRRWGKRLKNVYMDVRIYLHYRQLNPTVIRLSHSDHHVSVNPADARARKKLIVDSLRGRLPRNQVFWRRACQQLDPCAVLDIGVNYGECLFSVDYPMHTRVIGVEANPALLTHLTTSKSYHDNSSQIEIHNVLAGDSPSDAISFFVNQVTSGESTAATGSVAADPSIYEQVSVPQICLDELLQDRLSEYESSEQPIVFKIDVEGYEQHVFQGMSQTLGSSCDLVGLVEFDLAMLEGASSDPEQFFEFLQQRFEIYLFVDKAVAIPVHQLRYTDFLAQLKGVKFHSDLLLVRSANPQKYSRFLELWQPKAMSA
ncbi:MAG: FkbM family methyltransferase [Planctomycetota bacterium]